MRRFVSYGMVLFAIAAIPGYGQSGNENDILPCRVLAEPSQLATGDVNAINGQFTIPSRVFGETVADSGADDLRGDEGFFAITDPGGYPPGYGPLPGLVDLRFDFSPFALGSETANLWLWEPAQDGFLWFHPPENGEQFSLRKSPVAFFNATVAGEASGVPGFVIDRTSSTGGIHRHLVIVVDDADTTPATPVTPAIYVVAFSVSHPKATSTLVFEVVDATEEPGNPNLGPALEFFDGFVSECPGDTNADDTVDLSDFAAVQDGYGIDTGASLADGDFNADDDVDIPDASLVIAMLGTNCS